MVRFVHLNYNIKLQKNNFEHTGAALIIRKAENYIKSAN